MADARADEPLETNGEIFYFGTHGQPGHYLFRSEGSRSHEFDLALLGKPNMGRPVDATCPWGWGVDGDLYVEGPQGHAVVTHKGGWSALSFPNRTDDSRPGSNATFFTERPNLTFDEFVVAAREAFPGVFARFKFEIVHLVPERRP